MKVEFLVKVNSKVYEISELVTKVSYSDRLNDGCSKLEFSYVNENLIIDNGSIVSFRYNDTDIFYGYVFKVNRNDPKTINVIAYDQLRYCKAKDSIVVMGDTITTLVSRMCNYFKLKKGTLVDSKYILATNVESDKTWLDIIYTAISDTLMNKGIKYCLRDEFGYIALRDIEDLKIDLVIGDNSLCYSFDYEKSIDDEFYNYIKFYVDSEKGDPFIVKYDEKSVSKFGFLQYYENADSNSNISQINEKAKILLKLYNREVETLSLRCLGDTRIRAGSSFNVVISDIKLSKPLIVKEVTHEFLPHHTMSLEVFI